MAILVILQKLDLIQNEAIWIAIRDLSTSLIIGLHDETKILSLSHHRNLKMLQYYSKVKAFSQYINVYHLNNPMHKHKSIQNHAEICRYEIPLTNITEQRIYDSMQEEWTSGLPTQLHLVKLTLGRMENFTLAQQKNKKNRHAAKNWSRCTTS